MVGVRYMYMYIIQAWTCISDYCLMIFIKWFVMWSYLYDIMVHSDLSVCCNTQHKWHHIWIPLQTDPEHHHWWIFSSTCKLANYYISQAHTNKGFLHNTCTFIEINKNPMHHLHLNFNRVMDHPQSVRSPTSKKKVCALFKMCCSSMRSSRFFFKVSLLALISFTSASRTSNLDSKSINSA